MIYKRSSPLLQIYNKNTASYRPTLQDTPTKTPTTLRKLKKTPIIHRYYLIVIQLFKESIRSVKKIQETKLNTIKNKLLIEYLPLLRKYTKLNFNDSGTLLACNNIL